MSDQLTRTKKLGINSLLDEDPVVQEKKKEVSTFSSKKEFRPKSFKIYDESLYKDLLYLKIETGKTIETMVKEAIFQYVENKKI